MKNMRIVLRLAIPMVTLAAWGQQAPPTIASSVDGEISGVEKQILEAAEAMPEDKFNFSPESLHIPGNAYQGVRTFALQVKHVAASNYAIWWRLTGEQFPADFMGGDGPQNLKTKAEIIRFLKDSFALGHRAAATLTTENMLQSPEHSKRSRLSLAELGVAHVSDHYGQMVEYLRMNGIVPPASRGTSDGKAEVQAQPSRVVDLKAPDGVILRATYFPSAKPGPGVLLFHQSNRPRKSWEGVAGQLAAAGIHTLTVDMRGVGESGGTFDKWTHSKTEQPKWPGDIEMAWQYLVSQPGVQRDVIGVGGAGLDGVDNSVEIARRHPAEVKSLALLSGETFKVGLDFLRQASDLPGLFVVADNDEYPPTAEAMEWLYITSSNPGKRFVHYVSEKAPWLWYEPFDIGRVPATGSHGTDLFQVHPELPGEIVDWFVTTLIRTPGHAPANALASAAILNQIRTPAGVPGAAEQLREARRRDPSTQLFPEVNVDIIGSDYLRVGDAKAAIEIFKLNLMAYPDSADANANLAHAYLADGQKDLARQYAEKALALLDSHRAPASSWSDTEQRRGEIREDVQRTLKKLSA